ncbi:MAG: hypothetical protein K2N71_06445 [Oscillospiraceae bacterium]|nr:hypothetical protein [Oscillospiraceae bacterium]
MKKQLALIFALGLLMSGCSTADRQEVAAVTSVEETTVLEISETTTTITTASENTETTTKVTTGSENTETELTETTTKNTAVVTSKNKVTIGGRDYDLEPKYLSLYSHDLTADDADAFSQLTYVRSFELNGLTDDNLENVSKALSGIKDYSEIYFQLRDAEVSDLSFLTELPNLKKLQIIPFCHIDDYSALGNISALEELTLEYPGIGDVSQLDGLKNTNLKNLWLSHSSISDISFISSLKNLEILHISYTDVEDISPLSSLTNLKNLYFYGNVKDISPIAGLTGLERLHFDYYNSDCIDTLSKLPSLKRLGVNVMEDDDISSLGSLSGIEYLEIQYGFDLKKDDMDSLEKALPNCDIHYIYNKWLEYELEHK